MDRRPFCPCDNGHNKQGLTPGGRPIADAGEEPRRKPPAVGDGAYARRCPSFYCRFAATAAAADRWVRPCSVERNPKEPKTNQKSFGFCQV
jgi:hypothetical protein